MPAAAPCRPVVSGASSGLGLALARHYLERGAIVAAFARRGELLQTLAAEFPDQVFCYALDVRDALDAIENAGSRSDILCVTSAFSPAPALPDRLSLRFSTPC